jgi:hypothetical protein
VSAVLCAGRAGRAHTIVQRCGLRAPAAAAHRDGAELRELGRSLRRCVRRRAGCSRLVFEAHVRARARARYRHAIEPWRRSQGYRIPGEFVVVAGTTAAVSPTSTRGAR